MTSILIINENPNTIDATIKNLEQAGHTIFIAQNRETAINILEKEKPILALSDILSSVQEGLHMISELLTKRPNLRIIATYSENDQGKIAFQHIAKQLGAYASITKPIDISFVLSAIADVMHKEQSKIA